MAEKPSPAAPRLQSLHIPRLFVFLSSADARLNSAPRSPSLSPYAAKMPASPNRDDVQASCVHPRSAPWSAYTSQRKDYNIWCTLQAWTAYDTIHIRFPERRYLPRFHTFEGLPRCGLCGVLWTDTHRESCPERIVPRGAYESCEECGMPFQKNATGHRHRKQHPTSCRGPALRDAWQPTWDGTLRCPFCLMPGWTWESLARHAPKCTGNREALAKSRGKTVGILDSSWFKCTRCRHSFCYVNLFDHVCQSLCDPVWLGKGGVPVLLSVTYLDWCSQVPAPQGPCGFNGVHIGPHGEGSIRRHNMTREELVAESYEIPYTTNYVWDTGTAGKIIALVRRLGSRLFHEEQRRIKLSDAAGDVPTKMWDLVKHITDQAAPLVSSQAARDRKATLTDYQPRMMRRSLHSFRMPSMIQ